MTNLKKKTSKPNIDVNIERSFEIIDQYLPKKYTDLVLELLPGTPADTVRSVKCRRSGDVRIIAALRKVAEQTKLALNS